MPAPYVLHEPVVLKPVGLLSSISATIDGGGFTPAPVTSKINGLGWLESELAISILAESTPGPVGENVTVNVVELPAGTLVLSGPVTVNPLPTMGTTVIEEMVNGRFPPLLTSVKI